MQDHISDSKNKENIDKIKQTLLDLDRWDFAERPIDEIPLTSSHSQGKIIHCGVV
jgi:hypothetical protein